MMKQFLRNLVNKGQQLDKDKNTVESIFGFWPGATKKDLREAEAQIGRVLPEIIKKLYTTTNGLSIKWRYRNPQQPYRLITGRSNFPNLDKLFNKKIYTWQKDDLKEDVIWTSDANQDQIRYLSGFYILDDLEYGNYILFRLAQDGKEPELFLYIYKNQVYRLKIDLPQYLNLLEHTLGMYLWQQYFVADDQFEIETAIPDHFHVNMMTIMPKADLEAFKPPPTRLNQSVYNSYRSRVEKNDYLQIFKDKIDLLKEDQCFKKIIFRPNAGVHEGVLRKIRATLKRELPEDLLKFYFYMNGFKMSWHYTKPDTSERFYGNINLLPLENMFGVTHGNQVKEWDNSVYENILWFDDSSDSDIEVLKSLKRVEILEGVGWEITIRFSEEVNEYALYLWNKNKCYRLEVRFLEYIYTLSQTLGLHLWQLHLLDAETQKSLNIDLPYYDQILRVVPQADLKHLNSISH